jgi:hypothetical protein
VTGDFTSKEVGQRPTREGMLRMATSSNFRFLGGKSLKTRIVRCGWGLKLIQSPQARSPGFWRSPCSRLLSLSP